ncbi:DinB family protein [Amphibacillus sediminis]|uniref:DinB family protein n=1 Tax=Amphibacillus sediminis TaxID=360185 RepID=UPI0008355954|nr:DinB family protein [Amphibacillus sediminis]
MESTYLAKHFNKLDQQREVFQHEISSYQDLEWKRARVDKWSIGETYYHLYLMIRRFRQLNHFYLPLAKPLARLRSKKPYPTNSYNIYKEYTTKRDQSMKAPSIIAPPEERKRKLTFIELTDAIEQETQLLKEMLVDVKEEVAGHIRYPDPIAHYPNLIQSIDLLGIHEQHHFNLLRAYYKLL